MTAWLLRMKKRWSLLFSILTAILGAADQFLPIFQGMIPPMAYVALAITLALLPSVLERREKDRRL